MNWYVIYTKPKQEQRALQNLQQQGFDCYLPMIAIEKIRQGAAEIVSESLFPRYLFISLDESDTGKSWSPIRSTKGVSRLVTFGNKPAKVPDNLISVLHEQEKQHTDQPQRLFSPGDRVQMTDAPFTGVEGIYQRLAQIEDGESRAIVLIEILCQPARLHVPVGKLLKVG